MIKIKDLNANTSFRLERKWDKATQTTSEEIVINKSGELNFGATDKEQINRATIGAGKIIIGGKEENPNINRDESLAQEVTKNVNIDNISVEYKDNRRKWSDISDIMGEYGRSLGSDLDNMTGGKYDLGNKLGQGVYNMYRKIEDFIDYKLYNKPLGLIPTKNTRGGFAGELQSSIIIT